MARLSGPQTELGCVFVCADVTGDGLAGKYSTIELYSAPPFISHFETRSPYLTQADLELATILLQPLRTRDYRPAQAELGHRTYILLFENFTYV